MTSTQHPVRRGDAVRVRGERWRVVHVSPYGSCSVIELAGVERSNAGSTARFIVPFEPVDRLPASLDQPRVVGRAAWRRAAAAALASAAPSWQALRAAAHARVLLLPYQLEPALAMARGAACRFLLADEVGLGKTIQAGLLVAELLARERDARVLIVTPAGLRDQWRDELRDRFAIDARIIDAGALVHATAQLPPGVNPWAIPRVAIASIDFLKRADVIRSLEPLLWDLVAFDEAHALCGRSDRALAADLVAARARRVVIITATPHSGDAAAFDRLRALGRVAELDPLLVFRRSRADAGVPGRRVVRRLSIVPTPEEARMHRAFRAYVERVTREAPADTGAAARLAMIVLGRRASSSAASLARSIERRIALLDATPDAPPAQIRLPLEDGHLVEDEEPLHELGAPGLVDSEAEQETLKRLLSLARAVAVESKIRALQRLLRRSCEPLLVFTEYRDTLRHVVSTLQMDAAMLHGGLTSAERTREARRFTHGAERLLVATDAASEGLNLQRRCRVVINLDVPWSPVRLEQRIGRVDRLGQVGRVHAITFVARGTPEDGVASALTARTTVAMHEAPFTATTDPGAQAEAIVEGERLETVRRLTRTADPKEVGDRPVLTLLPLARRRAESANAGCAAVLAVRLLFVDSTGTIVWDTLKGLRIAVGGGAVTSHAAGIRSWFERLVHDDAIPLAAAATVVHDTELAIVHEEIGAAQRPLVQRERAMVARMIGTRARLGAPLVQRGLFDARAVRDADAQRQVIEDAAARARDRIAALERQCDVKPGSRSLVFAVSWAR